MTMQHDFSLRNFDDLMRVALADGPAQRLLLVLLGVERMHRRTADGAMEAIEGEGTLTPMMVRDRPLEAGLTFADIAAEADATGQSWEFLMVALLPGRDGEPPSSADAEPHLRRMAKVILTGADTSGFAFFDRDGDAVSLAASSAGSDDG